MPVWNSGKLFQVRPSNNKTKFIGKGYSGIGPAKRAITKNHHWAIKHKAQAERFFEQYERGEIQNAPYWDVNRALEYHRNSLNNPWLNPENFEIVEFAVIEKAIHKYTPPED